MENCLKKLFGTPFGCFFYMLIFIRALQLFIYELSTKRTQWPSLFIGYLCRKFWVAQYADSKQHGLLLLKPSVIILGHISELKFMCRDIKIELSNKVCTYTNLGHVLLMLQICNSMSQLFYFILFYIILCFALYSKLCHAWWYKI